MARSRWLGMDAEIEILVGPGQECPLGTNLLNPHRLEIDFRTRTVRLIPDKKWLTEPGEMAKLGTAGTSNLTRHTIGGQYSSYAERSSKLLVFDRDCSYLSVTSLV